MGNSRSEASSILPRVCRFNAGSSVIQRSVARVSGSASRSDELWMSASITAAAITVLPAPIIADSANEDGILLFAQSSRQVGCGWSHTPRNERLDDVAQRS